MSNFVTDKRILIASDHAGFIMKDYCKVVLESMDLKVEDLGTHSKESVDYPDYAHELAKNLKENEYGILICGTGIGISIAANRHSHIRAALCHDKITAQLAREHNDANVLVLGSRIVSNAAIKDILVTFFTTEFEGGRHANRVSKI